MTFQKKVHIKKKNDTKCIGDDVVMMQGWRCIGVY